jgi:hypothetical protein
MAQQPDEVVKKSDAIMQAAYEKMHKALVATGRPILFSMCQYGYAKVWEWLPESRGQHVADQRRYQCQLRPCDRNRVWGGRACTLRWSRSLERS